MEALKAAIKLEPNAMQLYETHIPVTETTKSQIFYTEVIGLPFAYRDPTRDIVFLWVDEKQKGMVGLWGPGTGYGRQNGLLTRCHLAFAVPLDHLLRAIVQLNERRIETRGFAGNPAREPSVIGWMPSAQIYFSDPDGHLLEFITILPQRPDPRFIGSYSEWLKVSGG